MTRDNNERLSIEFGQTITTDDVPAYIRTLGKAARDAASILGIASSEQKNHALHAMADAVEASESDLLQANSLDLDAARAKGIDAALLDRLELTPQRIASMAEGLRSVA